MGTIGRALSLGLRLARMTKRQVSKELRKLQKKGALSPKEARSLVSAAMREARTEKERVKAFVKQELTRVMKKAAPLARRAARRMKR